MLSEQLYEQSTKEIYQELPKECIFIGAKIKNLYDEKRLCIQENFKPGRYKLETLDYRLFGVLLDIGKDFKSLINKIKQQKTFDLIGYNLLLQEFKLSCNDCYFNLKPPIYPIDNYHVKKILPSFDYEKFICFSHEAAKFQSFTSLNLFLIVQD